VRTAAPLPLFFAWRKRRIWGKPAARRSRISQVPSVEQSSTITNSRSILSGSGAVRTREMQRSTTVRSLYTGIRIESFIGYKSHGSTEAQRDVQFERPAGNVAGVEPGIERIQPPPGDYGHV